MSYNFEKNGKKDKKVEHEKDEESIRPSKPERVISSDEESAAVSDHLYNLESLNIKYRDQIAKWVQLSKQYETARKQQLELIQKEAALKNQTIESLHSTPESKECAEIFQAMKLQQKNINAELRSLALYAKIKKEKFATLPLPKRTIEGRRPVEQAKDEESAIQEVLKLFDDRLAYYNELEVISSVLDPLRLPELRENRDLYKQLKDIIITQKQSMLVLIDSIPPEFITDSTLFEDFSQYFIDRVYDQLSATREEEISRRGKKQSNHPFWEYPYFDHVCKLLQPFTSPTRHAFDSYMNIGNAKQLTNGHYRIRLRGKANKVKAKFIAFKKLVTKISDSKESSELLHALSNDCRIIENTINNILDDCTLSGKDKTKAKHHYKDNKRIVDNPTKSLSHFYTEHELEYTHYLKSSSENQLYIRSNFANLIDIEALIELYESVCLHLIAIKRKNIVAATTHQESQAKPKAQIQQTPLIADLNSSQDLTTTENSTVALASETSNLEELPIAASVKALQVKEQLIAQYSLIELEKFKKQKEEELFAYKSLVDQKRKYKQEYLIAKAQIMEESEFSSLDIKEDKESLELSEIERNNLLILNEINSTSHKILAKLFEEKVLRLQDLETLIKAISNATHGGSSFKPGQTFKIKIPNTQVVWAKNKGSFALTPENHISIFGWPHHGESHNDGTLGIRTVMRCLRGFIRAGITPKRLESAKGTLVLQGSSNASL